MTNIVTLGASVIALLGSLLSLFISTRLTVNKERRQMHWSKELDRFFELEELAGDLVENLGGYRSIPDDRAELIKRFSSLEAAAGRFARYPEVRQAVRDLHNTLGRMLVAKRDCTDNSEEVRKELNPAFLRLLSACDSALGRRGVTD